MGVHMQHDTQHGGNVAKTRVFSFLPELFCWPARRRNGNARRIAEFLFRHFLRVACRAACASIHPAQPPRSGVPLLVLRNLLGISNVVELASPESNPAAAYALAPNVDTKHIFEDEECGVPKKKTWCWKHSCKCQVPDSHPDLFVAGFVRKGKQHSQIRSKSFLMTLGLAPCFRAGERHGSVEKGTQRQLCEVHCHSHAGGLCGGECKATSH